MRSKTRKILLALLTIIIVLLNIAIAFYQMPASRYTVNGFLTMNMDASNNLRMSYTQGARTYQDGFLDKDATASCYDSKGKDQVIAFFVPGDTNAVRICFAEGKASGQISSMEFESRGCTYTVTTEQLQQIAEAQGVEYTLTDTGISFDAVTTNSYLVWDASGWGLDALAAQGHAHLLMILKLMVILILDLLFVLLLWKRNKLFELIHEISGNRQLIFRLAKNDFKTKFAGSTLGTIWAFIQPIVTVVVYWFVFEKGLKAGSQNTSAGITVPFVLWLVAGLVPWFFFQDALFGGTNAFTEYSYLVKKVVFKISVLPIVKVISALFVHLFFIAFMLFLYAVYGFWPNLCTLQIIYYSFCVFMLSLGLTYLTSALVVFFRDLTQIINIILQVGVWATPIMWNIDTMDLNPALLKIFKFNPMYYVVAGYRDTLINRQWFWNNPGLTIYFWVFTIVVFVLGVYVFKKLKVHFADVL